MKNEKLDTKVGLCIVAFCLLCIIYLSFIAKKEYDRVYGTTEIETQK